MKGMVAEFELVLYYKLFRVYEFVLQVVDKQSRGSHVLMVFDLGVDDDPFKQLRKLILEVLLVNLLDLVDRYLPLLSKRRQLQVFIVEAPPSVL